MGMTFSLSRLSDIYSSIMINNLLFAYISYLVIKNLIFKFYFIPLMYLQI